MLTRLRIQNFKQFEDVEIELGPVTVFVGPNNSGKSTALQALALWDLCVRSIRNMGLQSETLAETLRQPMPVLERSEVTPVPVPDLRMLWRKLELERTFDSTDGIPSDEILGVELTVSGTGDTEHWHSFVSLVYENEASVSIGGTTGTPFMGVAQMSSMSGIVTNEPLHQPGTLNRLIGEGRTAEVLRNLCFRLYEQSDQQGWSVVLERMRAQFGVELLQPRYLPGSGLITMQYRERNGYALDLASAGRGMLQTLLLLAYLYTYPGAVLLLDEPDAHLEIIRQREIYRMLTDAAASQGSQIILATHSEVILKEAFERKDTVIAFTGRPHRLTDISNFVKSLSLIPAEDFVLADQNGWVLYCEGETDALILRAFAAHLQHEVFPSLQLAFTKDIKGNRPSAAKDHFSGLHEAYPTLQGIAVFDRVSKSKLQDVPPGLRIVSWIRREIENYLMQPKTLMAFARASSEDQDEAARREQIMREVVQENTPPIALDDRSHRFWLNTKASDEYLEPIFKAYSERAGLPLQLRKADYHLLVEYIPTELIDAEILEKLDAILQVARQARPLED